MSVLDDIMAHKRDEVVQQQARRPLARVPAPRAEAAPPPLDFVAALRETKGRASTQAPPFAHSPALPAPR